MWWWSCCCCWRWSYLKRSTLILESSSSRKDEEKFRSYRSYCLQHTHTAQTQNKLVNTAFLFREVTDSSNWFKFKRKRSKRRRIKFNLDSVYLCGLLLLFAAVVSQSNLIALINEIGCTGGGGGGSCGEYITSQLIITNIKLEKNIKIKGHLFSGLWSNKKKWRINMKNRHRWLAMANLEWWCSSTGSTWLPSF